MTVLSSQGVQRMFEDFNRTKDVVTLGHALTPLLELAAESHSDKTAVISGDRTLTYGELNARANRLARVLVERGIKRGDLVGVALDRSVDLVAVLVAVLKSGAAYVPIDPALPAKRMSVMIEDAVPKLVVADERALAALTPWNGICLRIDEVRRTMDLALDSGNLEIKVRADDLAYVIYTSGSTGAPKGVEVSHGSVTNFLIGMQRRMGCSKADRLLAVSTISFDMAVYELFTPLIFGATIIVTPSAQIKDARALLGLMQSHAVTMLLATPTSWQMLLHAGWSGQPRLRASIAGGEALPGHVAEKLVDYSDTVWNAYGPTEATGCACAWRVQKGEDMLIGKPLVNIQVHVLEDDLTPAPLGGHGELYIGGAGVACGYRNNPERTKANFIQNPFGKGCLYRTGDLACFVAPQKLKLLGRADSQVKIRGYRIELGDIEAAIVNHGDIAEAAVIYRDGQLAAYCVRRETVGKVSLDSIMRPWLAGRLPAYMVPAFFVELEGLPMTLNGKLDDKALPSPMEGIEITEGAAATELERGILAIWSKILGHDHIGTDDNFFQVGGDSARLMGVLVELEKLLGRRLSPAKLFEHYTIKSLAAYLVGTEPPGRNDSENNSKSRRHGNDEGIAVVSMACRLPGGITTADDFWEVLQRGGDAITPVPKDRWDADAIYDADPDTPGKSYCRSGGFVPSFASFDASFFRIPPLEARGLDPTHSMMLETCWEGLERAGYTTQQLRGSQTGVFIGLSDSMVYGRDYNDVHGLTDLTGYTGTGTTGGTVSGRLSYILGLEGPTLTVDTACSSSLVTTHLACTALRQGECDMAVSGAVSHMPTPGLHVEFSRLRGMSPDGRCRAFAADAQGTGLAEGAALVVLKRLSDARRDGDTIYGVIRGSAVNHGGRSAGLTVPHGPAQERLIRTALEASGLQPDDIDYVEAHGTGTKLGDPIEGMALAEVFGGRVDPLWIGSAKSNVGHTQAPAGLVGLIKVLLALQHRTLPPTLHAAEPTLAVDWEGANMALVQKSQPWMPWGNRLRRAGVSAFGIGGTNAHLVVEEEPPRVTTADTRPSVPLSQAWPFALSGHTGEALRQQADKLHQHLSRNKTMTDRLRDVAYSLATSRNHFSWRTVVLAKDLAELLGHLAAPQGAITTPSGPSQEPRLAMLFTGQGSQLPGMGKGLAQYSTVFREALDEIASHFEALERPLLDVMWADGDSDVAALLQRTDYAQPALFALEVALWRLWQSWGVQPALVVGHSIGELAAAHVAGVMDLSDACRLVAARGGLMQALPDRGGMLSLQASAREVEEAIQTLDAGHEVAIAGHNTPSQTVISGDKHALTCLAAYFDAQSRRSKMLEVARAFHSHHMDDMLSDFQAVAETVRFHPPKLDIVSTLTGKPAEPGQLEQPSYWVRQVRSAVHYSDAIQSLADRDVNIFLELGPRPLLCGMGAACPIDRDTPTAWLPSLHPNKDDVTVVQESLAELHVRHVPIAWPAYFKSFDCRRVELPTYAFLRQPLRPTALGDGGTVSTESGSDRTLQSKAFQIDWRPVNTGNLHPGGSWGLLCPAGEVSWAGDVMTALSRAGMQVRAVRSLQEAEILDGLLCLWDSDADILSQSRDFAIKALAQLQTAAQTGFAPDLVWLTAQAVGTGVNDQPAGLGAGPLWGMMRTVRSENPDLRLRLIDLDRRAAEGVDVSSLARLLMLKREPECAVRQGQVLVPRMQHVVQALQPANQPLLRPDGAVLITGGVAGLGARMACWLASTHGIRDLVLTSRRGMEAPGAAVLVDRLSGLGAKATIVAGDIADPDFVQSVMGTFHADRPLRGVFHAAGVSDAGVLSTLTPDRCGTTFAPKVNGAWHLHQSTQQMDLDIFAVTSSISGVVGMPGLGIYAASNAFLDALVHARRAQGLPATSVAYGTLSGGGMADGTLKATRAHLSQFGLDPLSPDESQKLLELAVRSGRALTVAAALDMGRLQNYLQERGDIPPLLHSLLRRDSRGERRGPDLRQALRNAPREQHADIMLRTVRKTVARALGISQPEEVDVTRPLAEVGIDSLTAILIRNQLGKLVGLTLSTNIAFINPNLAALSQFLLSQLSDSHADKSTPESPSQSELSPAASAASPGLNLAAIRQGCIDASFTFGNAAQSPSHPESVLVTGATGFIGAFIVHGLLERGIVTHCIVRAKDPEHAQHRIVGMLQHYDLWKADYASRLRPLVGDVSQFQLGLGEQAFNDLAERVDAIFHASGLVDWMLPLADYLGPNIVSTHEVLRLAATGQGKAVHLISTVATLPFHSGYDVPKDELEYCYATSKFMAERMVAAARWRGAQASVYRLPFITAAASTGHFRLDRGDFLHNLIVGSLEMGSFPSLDADLSIILPVDFLSKTVITVATQERGRIGQDFDFTNTHAPSFNRFFQLMATVGTGQPILPFSIWRQKALDHATTHPKGSLARIAAVIDGCTETSAAGMFKGIRVGAHVLGGEDHPAPAVDKQYVRKYVGRINAARLNNSSTGGHRGPTPRHGYGGQYI